MQSQTGATARPIVRERRGSALILVLVAMVVLLVLSTGAMFGSMQELRTSRTLAVQQRALAVAEYGMHAQLASWPTTRNAMANGAIDSTVVVVQAGDTARVRVQRLNAKTFNVVSIGRAGVGNSLLEAQRQTSMLVRVGAPALAPTSALTSYGNTDVQGSPTITGMNTTPSGWSGCSAASNVPAISWDDRFATASIQKPASQAVNGTNPKNLQAHDTATYTVFGTETWASLVAKANITVGTSASPSPVGTASSCTLSSSNWGEPSRSGGHVAGCTNYFPIIYAPNGLSMSGGRGQGILLVNGNLSMTGNVDFYGLVIVMDDIWARGTGSITGAVMSRNRTTGNSIQGNWTLAYSGCAVRNALSSLAAPRRSAQRSWAQIF